MHSEVYVGGGGILTVYLVYPEICSGLRNLMCTKRTRPYSPVPFNGRGWSISTSSFYSVPLLIWKGVYKDVRKRIVVFNNIFYKLCSKKKNVFKKICKLIIKGSWQQHVGRNLSS